ncbi:hypothetical protein ETB97_002085 [Aspergillus alliaceus]|uniref:Uncharacterized protein n=1 Tax=Petromyces alliaceus TaxID=209559 RepID=A0A8H6A4L6_PETAA|nr:hypothetical protein ETB97_002085 [Aspergillus burnettii]
MARGRGDALPPSLPALSGLRAFSAPTPTQGRGAAMSNINGGDAPAGAIDKSLAKLQRRKAVLGR